MPSYESSFCLQDTGDAFCVDDDSSTGLLKFVKNNQIDGEGVNYALPDKLMANNCNTNFDNPILFDRTPALQDIDTYNGTELRVCDPSDRDCKSGCDMPPRFDLLSPDYGELLTYDAGNLLYPWGGVACCSRKAADPIFSFLKDAEPDMDLEDFHTKLNAYLAETTNIDVHSVAMIKTPTDMQVTGGHDATRLLCQDTERAISLMLEYTLMRDRSWFRGMSSAWLQWNMKTRKRIRNSRSVIGFSVYVTVRSVMAIWRE